MESLSTTWWHLSLHHTFNLQRLAQTIFVALLIINFLDRSINVGVSEFAIFCLHGLVGMFIVQKRMKDRYVVFTRRLVASKVVNIKCLQLFSEYLTLFWIALQRKNNFSDRSVADSLKISQRTQIYLTQLILNASVGMKSERWRLSVNVTHSKPICNITQVIGKLAS